MNLRFLQVNLPWTIKYSQDHRSNPQPHKDFAHALHHVSKAAGMLHAFADDMDHDRAFALQSAVTRSFGKYVADLVVCALRLANTFPGGVIDLEAEVINRIETKNSVKLPVDTMGRITALAVSYEGQLPIGALRDGLAIRRKSWPNGTFMFSRQATPNGSRRDLEEHRIMPTGKACVSYRAHPGTEEIFADDWIVLGRYEDLLPPVG